LQITKAMLICSIFKSGFLVFSCRSVIHLKQATRCYRIQQKHCLYVKQDLFRKTTISRLGQGRFTEKYLDSECEHQTGKGAYQQLYMISQLQLDGMGVQVGLIFQIGLFVLAHIVVEKGNRNN